MTPEDRAPPTLPRELSPGLFWMADCLKYEYKGEMWHSHVSAYLIVGSEKSLLIDTGHPAHWNVIEPALDQSLGGRRLDYLMPTHSEMPHAGNLPRLVAKFPDAQIVGEIRDYHLYYPDLVPALWHRPIGDEIDLGDRSVVILPAIWRDLPSTIWAYDTGSRALFVADGFAYSHHHLQGQCALLSSELPEKPNVEQTMFVNERALFWTRHVDSSASSKRLAALLDEYPSSLVGPAHGSVIDNLDVMLPIMYAGMAAQRARARTEAVT